jgi:hypothetical protein
MAEEWMKKNYIKSLTWIDNRRRKRWRPKRRWKEGVLRAVEDWRLGVERTTSYIN